jgi:hypothetical protein
LNTNLWDLRKIIENERLTLLIFIQDLTKIKFNQKSLDSWIQNPSSLENKDPIVKEDIEKVTKKVCKN